MTIRLLDEYCRALKIKASEVVREAENEDCEFGR